jgi:hypothetical protein
MQFRASRSGASSGSGKEGWLRRTMRREVTARMSVSRLARSLSRVRRMSAGEKSEKTSSVDSGNSQNWHRSQFSVDITEQTSYAGPVDIVGRDLLRLGQAEDALLKAEFGVGRAHRKASVVTASCAHAHGGFVKRQPRTRTLGV